jgi:hypothetical protein
MLEEIEMAPAVLAPVMHRAIGSSAARTDEPGAAIEIQMNVEPPPLRVERGSLHEPRRRQAEGELEDIGVTHGPQCGPLASQPRIQNEPRSLAPRPHSSRRSSPSPAVP